MNIKINCSIEALKMVGTYVKKFLFESFNIHHVKYEVDGRVHG